MRAIEIVGQFFFRTRNLLFPLLLFVMLLVFQPYTSKEGYTRVLLIAGLVVLAVGQGLRVVTIGLDYIRRGGKNGRIYASRLVTGGLFAHCRNPMYSGNILITIGFFLISGNPIGVVVGSVLVYLIYAVIVHSEERYLASEFGDIYRAYCHDVPRWLPRLTGLVQTLHTHRFDWAAVVIREYGTLYTTILIMLVLLCWKSVLAGTYDQDIVVYLFIISVCSLAYILARYLKKTRRLRPMR